MARSRANREIGSSTVQIVTPNLMSVRPHARDRLLAVIDPKLLRTDPDRIKRSQAARGESTDLVDELVAADERRRALIASRYCVIAMGGDQLGDFAGVQRARPVGRGAHYSRS